MKIAIKGEYMDTMQSNTTTNVKKYEPHLSELKTELEQFERVREIILEADDFEEMVEDFIRYGVTKRMHFLQTFVRHCELPDYIQEA